MGRRKYSAELQIVFRLIKGIVFISFMTVLITLIALVGVTFRDIIVSLLAFMPTGWGLLLVSAHIYFRLYLHAVLFQIYIVCNNYCYK